MYTIFYILMIIFYIILILFIITVVSSGRKGNIFSLLWGLCKKLRSTDLQCHREQTGAICWYCCQQVVLLVESTHWEGAEKLKSKVKNVSLLVSYSLTQSTA